MPGRTRPQVPPSPGALGVFVFPTVTPEVKSRLTERRRSRRLKVPSIMYVQLGANNGGFVLNLGKDGIGCQAARQITAEKNSTLNLRLRGSGLSVNLVGELVWLGETKKDAGISFKSLSEKVQQDIAYWIAREAQSQETPELANRPQPKPMPAMPGIAAKDGRSAPHSHSAALAMSGTIPAESPSSADAKANESNPASCDSARGISDSKPPLAEMVSPMPDRDVPSDPLDGCPQSRDANSSTWREQSQVEQPLRSQPLPEQPPIENPRQSPAGISSPIFVSEELMLQLREKFPLFSAALKGKSELRKTEQIEQIPVQSPAVDSSSIVASEKALPPASEELPPASALPAGISELRKTEEVAPIPRDHVSSLPDKLVKATAAEKWIPPALLTAWSRGNRQRKVLIASSGIACLAAFALIFTLALIQVDSSSGKHEENGPAQQPAAQQTPTQPPPPRHAAVSPQPGPPQRSPLANLAHNLLGIGPDIPDAKPEINDDQLRVRVWTSKNSGFYYCTDSDYYKLVQPGTLMTQADALQSGYRPKLDEFCN